ncbi:unnamed protein product, partial [Prorocentrum cordatum]
EISHSDATVKQSKLTPQEARDPLKRKAAFTPKADDIFSTIRGHKAMRISDTRWVSGELNWCGKGKRASHQTAAGSDDDAATATNYFDESDLEAPTLELAKKMRSHSPMSLQPPPSHTLKSGSAGKVPGRAPSSRGGSSAGPGSAKKSDGRQGVAAKSVRAADEFEDDEADAEDELGPEAEEKERVWPEFEKRMAPAAFAAMKRELTSMFKQALRAIPYSNEASFKRLDKGYDQVLDDGDVATYKYKETKSDFIQKFSELDNDVNGIKAWRQTSDSNQARDDLIKKLEEIQTEASTLEEIAAGIAEVRRQQQEGKAKDKRKQTTQLKKHVTMFENTGMPQALAAEFGGLVHENKVFIQTILLILFFLITLVIILRPLLVFIHPHLPTFSVLPFPAPPRPKGSVESYSVDSAMEDPFHVKLQEFNTGTMSKLGAAITNNWDIIVRKTQKVEKLMTNQAAMTSIALGKCLDEVDFRVEFKGGPLEADEACMELSRKPFLVLTKNHSWSWSSNSWPFPGLPSFVVNVGTPTVLLKLVAAGSLLRGGLTALSALQQWAKSNEDDCCKTAWTESSAAFLNKDEVLYVPYGVVPFVTSFLGKGSADESPTASMIVFPIFPKAIAVNDDGKKQEWEFIERDLEHTFATCGDSKIWASFKGPVVDYIGK